MPVATETVYFLLRSGLDPHVTGSPAALQLKKCCGILAEQKGFIRQFWGVRMEDPSTFVWSIDWDDVQDHKNFINAEQYKTLLAELLEIFDFETVKPVVFHNHLTPDATTARQAPVTEFVNFMLPASATDEQKSALEDTFLANVKLCIEEGTATNYGCGWVLEESQHPDLPDAPAITFNAMVGWPSKEDHLKIRENPKFGQGTKKIVGMILPVQPGKSFFHVKFHGKK